MLPVSFGDQEASYRAAAAALEPFLRDRAELRNVDGIPVAPFDVSPGVAANRHYFSHPKWMESWIEEVHRYPALRERWRAVSPAWDDRVVFDIGCGPGNLFATMGGRPAALIGVDVALGSLIKAREIGYAPVCADAHDLPFRSGCADIVAICGSLHHCEDMERALAEAARLVKLGGVLVVDHDPQLSAWAFRGLGKIIWDLRLPIYRMLNRGGHSAADDEQYWALQTELHHRPGDGVTEDLFLSGLKPMGFEVALYPHNHQVGAEIVDGGLGSPPWKIRVGQQLSGIDPFTRAGAISLMCCAVRRV